MSQTDTPNRYYKTYSSEAFRIEVAGLSQKGMKRKLNQDRFLIKKLKGGIVAALADGMGGEPGGEKASALAVSGINAIKQITENREINSMGKIFHQIDQQILTASRTDHDTENMGTTLTALYINGRSAYWTHVGDTRIYLFRHRKLIQVTSDHTFAKFLLDEGEITPEQAKTHYSQHILEQCMGHGEINPETGVMPLEQNDLILLSSDGLHKPLGNSIIQLILNSGRSLEQKCDHLIRKTQNAKGNDDITAVLIRLSKLTTGRIRWME